MELKCVAPTPISISAEMHSSSMESKSKMVVFGKWNGQVFELNVAMEETVGQLKVSPRLYSLISADIL